MHILRISCVYCLGSERLSDEIRLLWTPRECIVSHDLELLCALFGSKSSSSPCIGCVTANLNDKRSYQGHGSCWRRITSLCRCAAVPSQEQKQSIRGNFPHLLRIHKGTFQNSLQAVLKWNSYELLWNTYFLCSTLCDFTRLTSGFSRACRCLAAETQQLAACTLQSKCLIDPSVSVGLVLWPRLLLKHKKYGNILRDLKAIYEENSYCYHAI